VILVDSSIWIDHLRQGDARLAGLLRAQRVLAHPFAVSMSCSASASAMSTFIC
jgi:hypothetical protein